MSLIDQHRQTIEPMTIVAALGGRITRCAGASPQRINSATPIAGRTSTRDEYAGTLTRFSHAALLFERAGGCGYVEDELLTYEESDVIFVLSKLTVVDETHTMRHRQLAR